MNTLSLWSESFTQEFASLFWKSALNLHLVNSAQGSIQKGWDIIETTRGQQVRQSLEMNPFPISTLDHRNNVKTIMKKVQQRFSLRSQGNPTRISKSLPRGGSATGIEQLPSLPSVTDAARLENAEVWIRWWWDCTTENINVNIILGFAILQLKYSTNPFSPPSPTSSFVGVFLLLLFFHKSTYNKICTERS